MKRALILINAYMRIDSYLYQTRRLREELALLGVEADVVPNAVCSAVLSRDGAVCGASFADYDFCIYLDKDKYLSYLLEKAGLRLFNSAKAVELCDDKMTTAVALAGEGVPMPRTVAGLLCFDAAAEIPLSLYERVEQELGYPFVFKTSYGSLGKGVSLVHDREEFAALETKYKCTPHLYQEFVAASSGKDVRVLVIGGAVACAMERRSAGDFRSNLELGGTAKPYDVPPRLATLCVKIADALGLDYCGIDLLEDGEKYLLCEVNSNAFFGGMERTTGVNVARVYAEYICRTVYGDIPRRGA